MDVLYASRNGIRKSQNSKWSQDCNLLYCTKQTGLIFLVHVIGQFTDQTAVA